MRIGVTRAAAAIQVDPRSDPRWVQLVENAPSDVFHSPAWMRVLTDTYDMEVRGLLLLDGDGQPRAGMPFVHVSDFLGDRIVSLPFSDYCDPLASDPEDWARLANGLMAQGNPVTLRCLHNTLPLEDGRFQVAKRAKWHGLDLTPDLEEIWSGVDSPARRAIRKAEREGVTVRRGGEEDDIRAFFDMHLRVRKAKYRLLAQPYRFFENIWRHIIEPGHGFVMLATYRGETIGGILFVEWRDTLYYKFNASNPGYLGLRPNDVMISSAIRYAKEKGLRRLDFGLSDWEQDSLVRYKRKYASEEKSISFLQHGPDRVDGRQSEIRRFLGRITELLTREDVPDSVSREAGDLMYRYFV